MKKIIAASSAAVMLICLSVNTYAASSPSVTVSNALGKNVTYQYSGDSEDSKNITQLMTELDRLTTKKRTVSQVLTVESVNNDGVPVDMYLRLTSSTTATVTPTPRATAVPETKKTNIAGTILDKYNLKITDASDNVIYSAGDKDSENGYVYVDKNKKYAQDIYLGRLNEQSESETKVYTVTVSLPTDITSYEISRLDKVEWSIVSDPFEAGSTPMPELIKATAAPTETPDAEATEAPKETSKTTESPRAAATPVPTPVTVVQITTGPIAPAVTAAPTPEPASTPIALDKGGVKKIGASADIKPGKYTATGSGLVKVYDTNGELKTSILLKDKNASSDTAGVDSYVLNLLEGETLEYEDKLSLKAYSSSTAAPKATAKAAATPKASTVKTTTAPAARAAATAAPAAAKTNPKTGDTAPIAGLSVIAVFGLGLFAFSEADRRRKKNND